MTTGQNTAALQHYEATCSWRAHRDVKLAADPEQLQSALSCTGKAGLMTTWLGQFQITSGHKSTDIYAASHTAQCRILDSCPIRHKSFLHLGVKAHAILRRSKAVHTATLDWLLKSRSKLVRLVGKGMSQDVSLQLTSYSCP